MKAGQLLQAKYLLLQLLDYRDNNSVRKQRAFKTWAAHISVQASASNSQLFPQVSAIRPIAQEGSIAENYVSRPECYFGENSGVKIY